MKPSKPPPRADVLSARSQALLSGLLSTDLDLAHTFLEVAATTANPEHRRSTLEHARTALTSIRSLSRRLEDPDLRREFESRSNRLESDLKGTEKAVPAPAAIFPRAKRPEPSEKAPLG